MDESANNSEVPIDGVALHALKVLSDDRGAVLHMLRADSALCQGFGEVYFSEINPGVVKGWKRHLRMTQRLTVPVGKVKFVIYDGRPQSNTRGRLAIWTVGRPDHYGLLIIPPLVWYGFQGLDSKASLIANCPDIPHDPAESELTGLDADTVPYRW